MLWFNHSGTPVREIGRTPRALPFCYSRVRASKIGRTAILAEFRLFFNTIAYLRE
jgi:hypothetical protein